LELARTASRYGSMSSMKSCTLAFRGALVAETQLTVRSVVAMVHMEGDVIFDLSNVEFIDEIGINALHYLIQSIHKQNGITRFHAGPQDAQSHRSTGIRGNHASSSH
jgi:anti-anti-sigma regulatory factor